MHEDEVSLGDVQRGQQELRNHIAENDRLIGETAHRVAMSRAITSAPEVDANEVAEKNAPVP